MPLTFFLGHNLLRASEKAACDPDIVISVSEICQGEH